MAEGFLSWKRALFWPRFKNGFSTSSTGISFFILLAILFAYDVYCVLHGTVWTMLLYVPGTYVTIGILAYCEALLRSLWLKFVAVHPIGAQTLNILTLIFFWQVRVIASGRSAPIILQVCCYALYALGLASYIGWHIQYLSVRTAGSMAAGAQVLTMATGAYLAFLAWYKPGRQQI